LNNRVLILPQCVQLRLRRIDLGLYQVFTRSIVLELAFPAASCTEEDLAGKNFLDFLSSAAAAKFSIAKELQARPGERPLWLPEGQSVRTKRRSLPKQRFRATSTTAWRITPSFFAA
jgi:hypothetical protein